MRWRHAVRSWVDRAALAGRRGRPGRILSAGQAEVAVETRWRVAGQASAALGLPSGDFNDTRCLNDSAGMTSGQLRVSGSRTPPLVSCWATGRRSAWLRFRMPSLASRDGVMDPGDQPAWPGDEPPPSAKNDAPTPDLAEGPRMSANAPAQRLWMRSAYAAVGQGLQSAQEASRSSFYVYRDGEGGADTPPRRPGRDDSPGSRSAT